MVSDNETRTAPPPSLGTLLRTTVVALIGACAILVLFVLPSEYGIDPLGVGRRLGLTDIANPPSAVSVAETVAGAPLAPTQNGPIGEYPREFMSDVFEFVLQPYDYIEYKYRMEKGATMIYAWTASADVSHDMHAERAGDGSAEGPAEESFDKRNRRQGTGSYTAPFAGIHGWFWENPGGEPITIRLTSAGYYTAAVEIRSDRSRHSHELRSVDQWPSAAAK